MIILSQDENAVFDRIYRYLFLKMRRPLLAAFFLWRQRWINSAFFLTTVYGIAFA